MPKRLTHIDLSVAEQKSLSELLKACEAVARNEAPWLALQRSDVALLAKAFVLYEKRCDDFTVESQRLQLRIVKAFNVLATPGTLATTRLHRAKEVLVGGRKNLGSHSLDTREES